MWRELRFDDSVRAVVLTGAGRRAFCTGIDRDAVVPQPGSPYMQDDPLLTVGPKANDLWKPVVAAVEGMACGGAFYLLGECEFIVSGADAVFFDPHTTYGMVSAYESVLLAQRMPYGEVARMMLMGTAERISARRAHEVGLVSELTDSGQASAAAVACATVVAGYPAMRRPGHRAGAVGGEGGGPHDGLRPSTAPHLAGQPPHRTPGGTVHRPLLRHPRIR